MLPVVEEVADHQHGGAFIEGEPVALVALGREDDLELPVRTQIELVEERVGLEAIPAMTCRPTYRAEPRFPHRR